VVKTEGEIDEYENEAVSMHLNLHKHIFKCKHILWLHSLLTQHAVQPTYLALSMDIGSMLYQELDNAKLGCQDERCGTRRLKEGDKTVGMAT